jgi:thiamine-monophosphate kinase
MSTEFDIIERFFLARAQARPDLLLGIGDDAALTRIPAGVDLVTATDALVEGTHFLAGAAARSVGHRCLAVNLSDIAAMGARPLWASLALGMPVADQVWVSEFADGFFALAEQFDVSLIGGDTVRAGLFAAVTVQGEVPQGSAIRRSGARAGDLVFVTGHLGDAAAGRMLAAGELAASAGATGKSHAQALGERFFFPRPRVQAGLDLRGRATAMIDVSDGLAVDLGRLLAASGLAADIRIEDLPLSDSLRVSVDEAQAIELALCGGEDYELCFTLSADHAAEIPGLAAQWGHPVTCIGAVVAGAGARFSRHGAAYTLSASSFEHFV